MTGPARPGLIRRSGGFALAGFSGFFVDAGITEALVAFAVSPYLARIAAVAAAIGVTYTINSRLTFADRPTRAPGRRRRYVAVSLAAIAVNYAVFALVVALMPGLRPIAGVVAGTAVGMVINYVGYSRLVFAGGKPDQAA